MPKVLYAFVKLEEKNNKEKPSETNFVLWPVLFSCLFNNFKTSVLSNYNFKYQIRLSAFKNRLNFKNPLKAVKIINLFLKLLKININHTLCATDKRTNFEF